MRDSAGIAIVENRIAGLSLPEWHVPGEPVLDIGGDESDSTQQLYSVAGAARLSDGRIIIAEDGGSRVRVYGSSESWLADWGRAGEGPGEFRDLGPVHTLPGDSVIIYDSRLRRFSLFAPSGSFVRNWSLDLPAGSPSASPIVLLPSQQWLARPGFSFGSNTPTGVYRDTIPYLRFDRDGAFLDSVGLFPAHQTYVFNDGGNTIAGSLPFLQGTHLASADSGFWVGAAARFEIENRGPSGRLLTLLRVVDAQLDMPQSRLDAWRDAMLADTEPTQRQFFERFIEALPRPEHVPAYTRLVTDVAGNLWVRGHAWPGDDVVAWHVFGADGRVIATATTPARLTVYAIGEDWLLGTWSDQDDIEHVRLLPIEKPVF